MLIVLLIFCLCQLSFSHESDPVCTTEYNPVCCDGKTYSNPCMASAQGCTSSYVLGNCATSECDVLCENKKEKWYKLDWETKIGPDRDQHQDCVFFGPHSECTKCSDHYEKETSSLFMSDIFKSSITEDDIKHMLAYLDKHNLCVAADGDHINAQDISVTKKQFKDTYLIRRAQYLVLKNFYKSELKKYNVLKEAYRSVKKTLSKLSENDELRKQYADVYEFYKHKYDVAYSQTEVMFKDLKRAEFVQKAAGDQYLAVFRAILGQDYPEHEHYHEHAHLMKSHKGLSTKSIKKFDNVVSQLWSSPP
jgi:hypothetical protein